MPRTKYDPQSYTARTPPTTDRDVLNLGCGADTPDSYTNVDVVDLPGVDVVHDLEETPWPFEAESFDRVIAKHILEHLETIPWGEIQRVLRPNGYFTWVYPIGHTRFEDSQHKHYWNYNTAAQVTGERKHDHESQLEMDLIGRNVWWELTNDNRITRWRVRYRLWKYGPGPWMSQIPGLYGEVEAQYRMGQA